MRKTWYVLPVLAAMAGCTVEVTFDPRGTDFSVAGSWTVNGAPATAASCSAAGIAEVGIVFYDGGRPYRFSEFVFPCANGSFDTRPTPVLAYGRYTTQWVAYDARGVEVGTGPMLLLDVSPPITHADLAPANFVSGGGFNPRGTDFEITGEWNVDGTPGNATNCAAAGIQTVAVVFYDQSDTGRTGGVVMGMAPCSAGKFDSMPMRIGRYGSYLTTYRALGSGGAILAETNPLPLTVSAPTTRAMLAPANFTTRRVLEVNVRWDTVVGPTMADGTCAEAGVARMSYQLRLGSATVAGQNGVACAPSLRFEDVDPGDYALYIEGETAAGAKNWMATCTGLVVEAGVESYNCFVDKVGG